VNGSRLALAIAVPAATIRRSEPTQADSTAVLHPLPQPILTSERPVTSRTISGTEWLLSEC